MSAGEAGGHASTPKEASIYIYIHHGYIWGRYGVPKPRFCRKKFQNHVLVPEGTVNGENWGFRGAEGLMP